MRNTSMSKRVEVWCALLLFFLSFPALLHAQLTVSTEKSTATYDAGTSMSFKINATTSGEANYRIYFDNNVLPIKTGKINVVAGETTFLPFVLNEPGEVFCEVTLKEQTAEATALFSPADIQPLATEPADFDVFWQAQITPLKNIPIDPRLTFFRRGDGYTIYKINLACIENRRVYGYISVPDGQGKFPAILTIPSLGSVANFVQPEEEMVKKLNALSMAIVIHNADVDQEDPTAYKPLLPKDKNENYYRYTVPACLRALDYLASRTDFDGKNMGVCGGSQGAGLALMTAALDKRVKAIAISNPALCEHQGLKYGKASGFPYYLRLASWETPAEQEKVAVAAAYYDAVHFARRYDGVVLATFGYQDHTTPSATGFAAINQIKNKKVVVHCINQGHNNPDEYWLGRSNFFYRHFSKIQPPQPLADGYFADAGEDKNTAINTPLSLLAKVEIDGKNTPNLEARWEKLEGEGTVSFTNANNYATNAIFSKAGRYVLRFSAYDYSKIKNKRFFVMSDYIVITVGSGETLAPPPPPNPTPLDDPAPIIANDGNKIDLELTMNTNQKAPKQYENIDIILTLNNNSQTVAQDVVVQCPQAIKGFLAFTNYEISKGNCDWEKGIWKIESLAAGQKATLKLQFFVLNTKIPVLFAQIQSALPQDNDSTPNNNNTFLYPKEDDEAVLSFNLEENTTPAANNNLLMADIGVELKANGKTYRQYDNITYTITATNRSNIEAKDIRIHFPLPEGTSFIYEQHTKSTRYLAYHDTNCSDCEVWIIPKLLSNETITLQVTLFITKNDKTLSATARLATADSNNANNISNLIVDIVLGKTLYNVVPTSPTKIGNIEIETFPNPFNDNLQIRVNSLITDDFMLSLYNSSGILVRQQSISTQEAFISWTLGAMPAGLYFLHLKNKNNTISKKIIKI